MGYSDAMQHLSAAHAGLDAETMRQRENSLEEQANLLNSVDRGSPGGSPAMGRPKTNTLGSTAGLHAGHRPADLDSEMAVTTAILLQPVVPGDAPNLSSTYLSPYAKTWLAFWILGTINNFSYVVVNSAAKSLADSFNQSDLIGVIQWANVGFGVMFKALNAFFLIGTGYSNRVTGDVIALRQVLADVLTHDVMFRVVPSANTVMMLAGLLIVATSRYISFWWAIFGIVCIGSASAFGER